LWSISKARCGGREVHQSMQEAGASLASTVEDARAELVTARRELTAAIRETEAQQDQALEKAGPPGQSLLAATQRRTVWVAAVCAGVAGLAGGLGGALLFYRLVAG
jgi:type VI protein secretion system component VasF